MAIREFDGDLDATSVREFTGELDATDEVVSQNEASVGSGFSVGNIARGIGERATDVAGNVAGFTATAGANLEKDAKLGGFVWENGSLLPSYKNAEEYAAIEAADPGGSAPRRAQRALTAVDFGYKPGTTWEEVKAADGFLPVAKKLAAFGLETGLVSAPDMAAAVVNAPVYFTSRTEEIAQGRAKNDGRATPDENDVAIGASTAAIVSAMEKFGAERVFNAFIKGGTAPSKILKAAVGEGGTEFVQEQIEYAGESAGTKAGWTPEQSLERGVQGLVGGVTTGGTLGGVGAVVSRGGKPRPADPVDAAIEDANAIVDSALAGDDPLADPFAEQLAEQNATRQAETDAAMPDQGPTIQINPRARAEVYPTGPVRVPLADFEPVQDPVSAPKQGPAVAPAAIKPGIPTVKSINRSEGVLDPANGRQADIEVALNEPASSGIGEGGIERTITAADYYGIREGNPSFPIRENRAGSITVGGDPKALRETLSAAGVQVKGLTGKKGTTFPVKHAAAVRAALEQSSEQRGAQPVAESQALVTSEPGGDGVAPIQAGAAPDASRESQQPAARPEDLQGPAAVRELGGEDVQWPVADAALAPSGEAQPQTQDPITKAVSAYQTKDQLISYLNGRIGRKEVVARRDEIEQAWANRTAKPGQEVALPPASPVVEPAADRRQVTEPVAADQRQGERRSSGKARALYEQMSKDELIRTLLHHELTGIKGKRAFVVEVEDAESVISIDADSLKWVNDNMSPDSGDRLLHATADALVEEFGYERAYHTSGDEFYVLLNPGESLDEAKAAMDRVEARVKATVIELTLKDGTYKSVTGITATPGYGATKSEADYDLKARKTEREAAGQRAARGERPAGAVVRPAPGGMQSDEGNAAPDAAPDVRREASQEVAAKPSPADDRKAAAILDAANVRGDSRLNAIEKFRSGTFTLKDLEEAYPPKPLEQAAQAPEVSGVTDTNVATKVSDKKAPWQMTREEWGRARDAVRPDNAQSNFTRASGSEAAARARQLAFLLYGVNDSRRARLKAASDGEIKMSSEEAQDILERINSPVSHEDVVRKALGDGMPVPAEVMADYPDLEPQGADTETNGRPKERANFARANPRQQIAEEMVYRGGKPAAGMQAEAVSEAIAPIVLTWGDNAPGVEVVATQADLPAHIQRQIGEGGSVQGVHDSATGTVYLIADNLANKADAYRILAHEAVGHYGLEEAMGDTYQKAVDRVKWMKRMGNKKVRALADRVAEAYPGADPDTEAREILAMMAEERQFGSVLGDMTTKVYAAIRAFLRKMGFRIPFSNAEIDAMLARSVAYLRESGGKRKTVTEALEHPQLGEIDVALGKGRMGASKFATENPEVAANLEDLVAGAKLLEETATRAALENDGVTFDLVKKAGRWVLTDARVDFARSPFTETEAFRKWFGDSKVVDAEGQPMVVYHGTVSGEFDNFGIPAFFTEDRRGAEWFAQGEGGRTESAFLSVRNPLDISTQRGALRLISLAREAGVEIESDIADNGRAWSFYSPEISKYSDYDGTNVADLVYIPSVRDKLESAGYDGLRLSDTLENGEIPAWVAFRPEQIKSTGNRDTFDPSDARINFARSAALPSNPRNAAGQQVGQSWVAEAPSKLDDLIYSLQDKQIDLKKAVKAVKDQIGAIADKFDPYLQEELYHGRSAKGVKDFLDTELRPLLQEMQMRKVEMAELEEFLHMRHAEERNAQIAKVNPSMQDEGSGVSTADARAYLANLDPAKRRAYEALAKRVDAINASTRKLLVDTGLETQETIDAWEKTYKNYVPLQREDVEGGMGTGSGFSVRGSSTKRAMGSKRAVADILANVAMQRERAIVRAEKNRVAQALYGLAVQAPNPDYWIAVDPNNPDMAAMQQALVDLGANPIDAQNIVKEPKQRYVDPRTGLVTERINPALRSADNVVAMRVNGEDKFVFMSTKDLRAMRMAQTMKNLDADELGRALQVSAKVTRWMASVNTQYNPIFGVVNLTRDVQGALLNLSSTPLAGRQAEVAKNTLAALRGIYIDLRDRRAGRPTNSSWAQLWEEFQNEGGQTGYKDMFRTSKDRAEAIEKEIRKIGEGKAKGLGRAMFDLLSDYNETMENSVRLAAYKVAKDQGMTAQRAASLAKSLTVNFNRKGQVATQAGALYAFFNASVQGTARIAETLSGPMGKKIIIGGVTLGAIQAVTLAMAGFDEDEPPEFVRERALIIPMGGGDYLSVPMPLGFHVLPNIGRITTEWALSGFRDTGKRIFDFTGLTLDAFNPIGNAGLSLQTITPTAIDPLAALAENKDWTGKPIAMEDFNSLHPTPGHSRARDTASWISKSLSYWMNAASGGTDYKPGVISWTPDQIDYFIGQATGGVGREAMKIEQTATSLFTGEELPRHKIPLVGRFFGTTEGQSAEGGKFYENLRRINEHRAEIEGRQKNREPVLPYLQDNPEARLFKAAQKYESEVGKLRKRRREMIERGASKEQIKLIDQRLTAMMAQFNDQVRALREKR